jgi:hypothetical protein
MLLNLLFLLLLSNFSLHLKHHFLHSNRLSFIFSMNLSLDLILEINIYLPIVFQQFSFEIFNRLPEFFESVILYQALAF